MTTHDDIIDAAARRARAARVRVGVLMASRCPGPHQFVAHRDRRPPWCHACRRIEAGFRIDAEEAEA